MTRNYFAAVSANKKNNLKNIFTIGLINVSRTGQKYK